MPLPIQGVASALLLLLPTGSPEALTLDAAQALAREQNEQVGIAAAQLEQARALRREAFSALYPSLVASGTYTRRSQELTRALGDTEVVLQEKNALSGQLVAELDLFDARAFVGLEATGHALDAQELESREIERALAFDVAGTFYLVLAAESLRGAAERRVSAAAAAVEEAKRKLEAGLFSKNEATRTELERASAELAHTSAITGAKKARLSLGFLLGEPIGDRPLIEPPPSPVPALAKEELDQAAEKERADLQALRLRFEQAEAVAREPLMRLVPTLGVQGVLFASNEAGFSGREVDGYFAATVTWALFDGGERYAVRDQRLAAAEETRLRVEEKSRAILVEVEAARLELENARASLVQAEVRARVAAQNAEEVRVLFASGLAGALEQVDATASDFEASAELVRQKALLRVAELSLLRVLGRWPPGAGPASAAGTGESP